MGGVNMETETKINRIIKISEENVDIEDVYNICDLIGNIASKTRGNTPKFNMNIEITQIR